MRRYIFSNLSRRLLSHLSSIKPTARAFSARAIDHYTLIKKNLISKVVEDKKIAGKKLRC